jgi:F420-non-reducing hydrogenase iron-sulfur subunit
MDNFQPKIVGFFCNWCSYAAADLAGVSRLQYPPNIRIIRVMCSGRVGASLVLKAFSSGADGVLVCGCHPGECHYIKGNLGAKRRITGLRVLLDTMGIEQDRLRIEWISGAEGPKAAGTIRSFTQSIQELGPSPLRRGER